MCGDLPKPGQFVYLVWVTDDSYSVIEMRTTDPTGRWIFENVEPITVAVVGDKPKSMPEQVMVVQPDKITDLGNVALADALCREP